LDNSLEGRVGYQLKRVQQALRNRMDEVLRDLGLTTPQYAALSVLADGSGLSGAELARRSFVTAQTMNGILANLEAAGLIERRPHPEHGRVLQAYLTESGERLVSRAHEEVGDIEELMLSDLASEEHHNLLEMLRVCTNSLENVAAEK
jgi:DNA-binding MarR family transcriptional regulator